MTDFEINERVGRNKAMRVINTLSTKFKTEEQQDLYSRYDIGLTGHTAYIIECKDRDFNMDDYEWYILEKDKYNALKDINSNAIYLNTFKDGKYCLWFLNDLIDDNTPTIKKMMWHSTTKKDYKVEKEVYELKPEQARFKGYIEENDMYRQQLNLAREIMRKMHN